MIPNDQGINEGGKIIKDRGWGIQRLISEVRGRVTLQHTILQIHRRYRQLCIYALSTCDEFCIMEIAIKAAVRLHVQKTSYVEKWEGKIMSGFCCEFYYSAAFKRITWGQNKGRPQVFRTALLLLCRVVIRSEADVQRESCIRGLVRNQSFQARWSKKRLLQFSSALLVC